METEVRQIYAGAFSERVAQGERQVRRLSPERRETYRVLKQRVLTAQAAAAQAQVSRQQYLAVIDAGYTALQPYWRG